MHDCAPSACRTASGYDSGLLWCSVRPVGTTGDTTPTCVVIGDNGQLGIYNPQSERRTVFAFDKVFDEHINQEAVRAAPACPSPGRVYATALS